MCLLASEGVPASAGVSAPSPQVTAISSSSKTHGWEKRVRPRALWPGEDSRRPGGGQEQPPAGGKGAIPLALLSSLQALNEARAGALSGPHSLPHLVHWGIPLACPLSRRLTAVFAAAAPQAPAPARY